MRAAIYSNVRSIHGGGGLSYVMSLASALSEENDVDVYFDVDLNPPSIYEVLPQLTSRPEVRRASRMLPIRGLGELYAALTDIRYDTVVAQSSYVPRTTFSRRSCLLCEFPFSRAVPLDDRIRLTTYRRLIANSNFTAKWIERRWNRRAHVLYPPTVPVQPAEKRPYILAVGRFVGGGRSKRQLEMVELFRRLREAGMTDWELHLAGFGQDESYIEKVRTAAAGLPVFLHLNADRPALERLYARSSIFWHAVGEGVDPETEPGRMEHFGITTAEAMSAGCVPVVINRGGQPEVVGDAGVLWETFDECVDETRKLIRDVDRRSVLSQRASERAERFAFPVFKQRVSQLFSS